MASTALVSARLQVLLAALCFATTGTAQALGPDGAGPVGVGAARILVGGARSSWSRCSRRGGLPAAAGRRGAVAAAVAGVAVYQLAFFLRSPTRAWRSARSSRSARRPRWPACSSGSSTAAGPRRRWAAATALACAGVVLLALSGGDASVSAPGIALAVVAGGVVRGLHARRQAADDRRPRAGVGDGGGVRARRRRAPARARRERPGWLLHADGIALALFLGLIPTALAYVLFARGLRA